MTRSNLLWGLGGAIIGAVTTYFVMEYIYERELEQLWEEENPNLTEAEILADQRTALEILDAEQYVPDDTYLHVVADEEHQDEEEELILDAIRADEEDEETEELEPDPDQEEEVQTVDVFNGIYVIDVKDVAPGRRIVGRFNHDTCNVEISTVMSVKTDIFDEEIEERLLEDLLGDEGMGILMNAEPSKQDRMLAVRNNLINLDFAISY